MSEGLLSVGVDVGTTTTQLILSRIRVRNRASAFAVPDMEITDREVIYRSDVHFTPLIQGELVDGEGIRAIVAAEYGRAGVTRQDVDTGAIIITGETSRKENAAAVLAALSDFAGDFVVATAGPDLESVLAAKGAGAVDFSEKTGRTVLHMDIGGGTSNLALVEDGAITATACLNVGGRLLKFDGTGRVTYRSPVLEGLAPVREGELLTEDGAMEVARLLAGVLEMAAGLREKTDAFTRLTTHGTRPLEAVSGAVISFSGGVADCVASERDWLAYGDLGPLLGRAIRESALCKREYRLGAETIRATVIGAGCHSAQLSGSTVFYDGVGLPLKNLPVARPKELTADAIRASLARLEEPGILAIPGWSAPSYSQVTALADAIAAAVEGPCYVALEADMAKALGNALRLRLGAGRPILCIDRVRLPEGSYLDVGAPLGPALPVVVKTLILEAQQIRNCVRKA